MGRPAQRRARERRREPRRGPREVASSQPGSADLSSAAKIFPTGKVRVVANGPDAVALACLPYVRRGPHAGETWWTYVPDLRRDLAGIRFVEGSREALLGLLDAVQRARVGDDDWVRSLFDPETPPRPFQLVGIHFGLARPRMCLSDSTGLGKTIQALGVMLGLFARGEIRRAVLVVPGGLRTQWLREVSNKSSSRVLPAVVKVAGGSPASRRRIYRGRWNVLILSPEAVRNDREALATVAPTVGLVVVDEASILKNVNQTSQALHEVFAVVRRRIALTATPIENDLHNLYEILRWVDPRTFLSRAHFERRYIEWRLQRYTVFSKRFGKAIERSNLVPKRFKNLAEVRFKIAPVFLRRTPEEVGEQLPPVVLTREVLELGRRQREVYKAVAERTRRLVEGLEGLKLQAPIQNLRGACDSTELVAEGRSGPPASVKGERIRELLEGDFRGEQVIVFTDFAEWAKVLARDLRALRPALLTGDCSPVEKRVAVDSFVRGKTRVLLTTKAGERGHNLQVAGIVILADIPWNPAAIKQRIGRVRRIGSRHSSVTVRCLIADDTVESKLILPKLDQKERLSFDVLGNDEIAPTDPFRDLDGRAIADLL